MNNCRAGLYGFASTTAWLHKTGMASPPSLVMLGLTLPDSRILNGIASIGLTLANIAIILPYLRQPLLYSIQAHAVALSHEQCAQQHMELFQNEFNIMRPVDLNVESPRLGSISSPDREHQNPSLASSTTTQSVCLAVTESLECLDVDSEVSALLPPAGETDDSQTVPQAHCSPVTESSELRPSLGQLLARNGRSVLHIPLPVPDEEEVAFFDTVEVRSSVSDLQEQGAVTACEQQDILEERPTAEVRNSMIEKGGELVSASLSSKQCTIHAGDGINDMAVVCYRPLHSSQLTKKLDASGMAASENIVASSFSKATIRDEDGTDAGGTVFHLPEGLDPRVPITQTGPSLASGKEVLVKQRPESLEFVPQSVVRRYPSAPLVSARPRFRPRASSPGSDRQFTPAPPHILVQDPETLLEGPRPRANYTRLEGHWHVTFLPEAHPTPSTGGTTSVIETAPIQNRIEHGLASRVEPPTIDELTPVRNNPSNRRRLGVLARAALRDRRFTARQHRNDAVDGSSSSDSDSESDSDSQDSSGSSADESILPHILGADLIAAINANSETELNLLRSRKTKPTPLDIYGDFLLSEDSTADVSMVMQVSTIDDAADSEAKAPATSRALTYEDIQQWATGVVQKCVRQVCRSRAPVEPLSPSHASDVCAERPSGSGVSQCPLSGLHCRLGVAASVSKALPGSVPPTPFLPGRKPLAVRHVRDIPEFVPRQPHVSAARPGARWPGATPAINVTRDAATEVIARMESQAGFHARQRVGGGRQGSKPRGDPVFVALR